MIQQPKQLIVIGDSSVYGWGDNEGGGWCERLRKKWLNIYGAPIIYPLGVRGDGLEKVSKRCKKEWQCRGELRRKVPNALLLAIGLNDTARIGSPDGRPQLSLEAFELGLKSLLVEMKEETNILMIGITAVNEFKMPFAQCLWYTNESCSKYEEKIKESCEELHIPFLPIHKELISSPNYHELISDDGIHLNTKGHCWIYNKLDSWPALLKWAE